MIKTRLTELLGIEHPVVQGGMRGLAYAELVAAVSNAGGLGLLSAHTLPSPEALRQQIQRAQALTTKPFGVNLTVLPSVGTHDYDGHARVIIEMGVPVVETSGGNPAKYIDLFKKAGIKVVHKVSSSLKFALKAESLGADAVSLHSFECAGHPGEDDIPALILVPAASSALKIPVLSSGGVVDGRGLAAVLALGGEGVVVGTRFAMTRESILHPDVKARMAAATIRDTAMVGRSLGDSARVWKNPMVEEVLKRERSGQMTHEQFSSMVDAPRWIAANERADVDDGAYPAGMGLGLIDDVPTVAQAMQRIVEQAEDIIRQRLAGMVTAG